MNPDRQKKQSNDFKTHTVEHLSKIAQRSHEVPWRSALPISPVNPLTGRELEGVNQLICKAFKPNSFLLMSEKEILDGGGKVSQGVKPVHLEYSVPHSRKLNPKEVSMAYPSGFKPQAKKILGDLESITTNMSQLGNVTLRLNSKTNEIDVFQRSGAMETRYIRAFAFEDLDQFPECDYQKFLVDRKSDPKQTWEDLSELAELRGHFVTESEDLSAIKEQKDSRHGFKQELLVPSASVMPNQEGRNALLLQELAKPSVKLNIANLKEVHGDLDKNFEAGLYDTMHEVAVMMASADHGSQMFFEKDNEALNFLQNEVAKNPQLFFEAMNGAQNICLMDLNLDTLKSRRSDMECAV